MKGEFLDNLNIEVPDPVKKIMVLKTDLRYKSSDGRLFTIPEGFECDLASVPWWLRSIAPPWHQSARAGVLHDCGYRWFEIWKISKGEIDKLFFEALVSDNTGKIRSYLMKIAVNLFGHFAWNKWRKTPEKDKGVKPVAPQES